MEAVPTKIELKVGETYTLRLKGLGSAGYVWEHTIIGNEQVVSVTSKTVRETPQTEGETPAPRTGSADVLFHVKALEPGRVTLQLVLRRPWEKDKPPLREYSLEVSVVGS